VLFRSNELTLADRVNAQKAIEQVYWSHRIWPKENPGPKPPLSEVLPDTAIGAKVKDYVRKSNALEKWWKRPITAEQLQAEMERVAQNSREPEVLRELYSALGEDPFLMAECLARPMLADRLLRNWYAVDTRFHGELRRSAERALARKPGIDEMQKMGPRYTELTMRPRRGTDEEAQPNVDERSVEFLSRDQWDAAIHALALRFSSGSDTITSPEPNVALSAPSGPRTPARLPIGRLSSLIESTDAFSVVAVLDQGEDYVRTGTVTWPKTSFDDWWSQARLLVSGRLTAPPGTYLNVEATTEACSDDTWKHTMTDTPDPRFGHTAIWTGSEMIVWGGFAGEQGGGSRYNPATDTWTQTSTGGNAPTGRSGHTAVWTGSEMLIWGGQCVLGVPCGSGGRYNPGTDTWLQYGTTGSVPFPRSQHTSVWTGTEMIIWGGKGQDGNYQSTGARYRPSTNTWYPVDNTVNVPSARYQHTAVWTGTEMIVWGGATYDPQLGVSTPFNTGGRYTPSTNSWRSTSINEWNVPAPRYLHTAVWTGTEMIVWGGQIDTDAFADGGRYNPTSDSWTPTGTGPGVPTARRRHTAVWTGSEMIVWGGKSSYPVGSPGTDRKSVV